MVCPTLPYQSTRCAALAQDRRPGATAMCRSMVEPSPRTLCCWLAGYLGRELQRLDSWRHGSTKMRQVVGAAESQRPVSRTVRGYGDRCATAGTTLATAISAQARILSARMPSA